jgi:hypothetical protein
MTAEAPARSRIDLVSAIVLAAFGLFTLSFGLWALIDPQSFYDNIAEFPPYNKHLLHDVGAFQVGVGAALLFALLWRGDAMLAALGGGAAGATAHEIAHIADDGLGGRDSDPVTLGVIAAVLVVVFAWRLWERYRTRITP